jgi:hypothetical protein
MLVLLACLPATRLLPAGYARTVVAAPIVLTAPGSVMLGAAFRRPHRPSGPAFVCWAVLLSVVWLVLASLALEVLHVKITAASTYVCLVLLTAAMTIVAGRRMRGPRSARIPDLAQPDESIPEARSPGGEPARAVRPAMVRGGWYAMAAAVAGLTLLAGGAYARDHLSHPAPVGYTWLAWAGPQVKGILVVGAHGTTLPFQVVHQELGTATFRLSANWQGSPPRPLASPLTFAVGPNRTYHGNLFVPPLSTGCTYRVVLTLTGPSPGGSVTTKPRIWSINADVRDPGRSQKKCR